jgi:hypothetical protein
VGLAISGRSKGLLAEATLAGGGFLSLPGSTTAAGLLSSGGRVELDAGGSSGTESFPVTEHLGGAAGVLVEQDLLVNNQKI